MDYKDNITFSFRLNLNNPDHMLIYQTLMGLNSKIYKSKSAFITESLAAYIKSFDEDEFSNAGEERMIAKFMTKEEFQKEKENLSQEIRHDVLHEVMKILFHKPDVLDDG